MCRSSAARFDLGMYTWARPTLSQTWTTTLRRHIHNGWRVRQRPSGDALPASRQHSPRPQSNRMFDMCECVVSSDAGRHATSSYLAAISSVISCSCSSTQPKVITRFEDVSILPALVERKPECEVSSADALFVPTLAGIESTTPPVWCFQDVPNNC